MTGVLRDRLCGHGWLAIVTVGLLLLPGPALAQAAAGASEPGEQAEQAGASGEVGAVRPGVDRGYVDIDAFVEQLDGESASDGPTGSDAASVAGDPYDYVDGEVDGEADEYTGDEAEESAPAAVASGNTAVADAGPTSPSERFSRAGEVAMDVALLRPLNALASVAGFGFFVAASPLLVLSGDLDTARNVLVVEPARYAFDRPVGRF